MSGMVSNFLTFTLQKVINKNWEHVLRLLNAMELAYITLRLHDASPYNEKESRQQLGPVVVWTSLQGILRVQTDAKDLLGWKEEL